MATHPLVVPDAVQIRLVWQLGGLHGSTVLGARIPSPLLVTQTLANTLGAAIKSRLSTSGLVAQLATGMSLVSVGIRDLRQSNNVEFLDTGAAVPGTEAGDLLPPQVALVCTLRTAKAGASFRGRAYFWGFTETNNAPGGVATAGTSTAIGAFMESLRITDLPASQLTMAIISRAQYKKAPVEGDPDIQTKAAFITDVTSCQVRNVNWDTQRRRSVKP